MRFDGRDLVLRAIDGLGAEPVWSASCRLWDPDDPAEQMRLDLVVRPGRELMRWPTLDSVVLFDRRQAYVFGDLFRDSVIGEPGSWSPAQAAARDAALGGCWIRCDETWFRRQDRDHSPYGMLRKSLELFDDDRVGAPTDERRIVPVFRDRAGNMAVYEVDSGTRPPRLLRVEAEGELVELRYDDHPVDWPDPSQTQTLSVEDAMARVRPPRRGRQPAARAADEADIDIVLMEGTWQWSITCRNLAQMLGVANGYEAETAVRHALADANPALLQRLQFDSEAGMFAAYADSESDARGLRNVLDALASGT